MSDLANRRILLVITLIALVVVPLAAVGLWMANEAGDAIRERVADGQIAVAESVARDVEQDYLTAFRYTDGLAKRPGFVRYITEKDSAKTLEVFELTTRDGAYFRRLTAYTADRKPLAAFPRGQGTVPLGQNSSNAAIVQGEDEVYVPLEFAIRADAGEGAIVGWLAAEVSLPELFAELGQIEFGSTGTATLVDSNGRVLTTGEPLLEGGKLRSRELLGAVTQRRNATVSTFSPITDRHEQAAVASVADPEWSVVITQASDEALESVAQIRRSLWIVLVAAMLAGMVFAWWLARVIHDKNTRLLRLNRELELANQSLEQADASKSRFLAMASHELRTPLTAISGFTKTMLTMKKALTTAQRDEFLEIIDRQAERLSRLVNDLLVLSQITSGRLTTHPAPVNISIAIKETIRELGARQVQIECPDDTAALVDGDHLQQILVNYIGNAVKYGAEPIRVSAARTNGCIDICVSDHGDGVPDTFVPELFESFSRSDTTARQTGTGLGLSIVRGLAEAHGGRAWYEPNEPHGSQFKVRLPAAARD